MFCPLICLGLTGGGKYGKRPNKCNHCKYASSLCIAQWREVLHWPSAGITTRLSYDFYILRDDQRTWGQSSYGHPPLLYSEYYTATFFCCLYIPSNLVASLHCSTLLKSYRNCLHEFALPLYLGTYWLSALHCLPYNIAYEGSVKLWPPFLLHYSSTLASLQHSSLLMADRNSLDEFTLPLFTRGQLSWSWTFLYAST